MQYDQPMDSVEIYEGLNYATDALSRVLRPTGRQTSPGRTCQDIKEANPDAPSGDYWIDPNGESSVDAILVHCDMDSLETCVHPSPSAFSNQQWTKDQEGDGQLFMEHIKGNEEFTYKAENQQMKYLQLLSEEARQNVTYNCLNSQPSGARLLLHSGDELDTSWPKYKKTTYITVRDDCARDNQWHSAVFDVRTSKTDILPITDIRLYDVGRQNQQFGVQLGLVCFS